MNFAEEAKRIIADCEQATADDWAADRVFFENGVPYRIVAKDLKQQSTADMLTKLLNRMNERRAS